MRQENSNSEIPERPRPIDPGDNIEIERLLERIAALENKFESSGVSQEAIHRSLRIQELRQRIWIQRIVIGVGVPVLLLMSYALFHMSHQVRLTTMLTIFSAYSTLAIVSIVAPIFSITSISAFLMIAAFRGFKGTDLNVDKASLIELARAGNGN